MGCRSIEKFNKARDSVDKLLAERGEKRDRRVRGKVIYWDCDVSSLDKARKAAKSFTNHPEAMRLDISFFCAGAPSTWGAKPLSEDGIDLIMYVGDFVLVAQ